MKIQLGSPRLQVHSAAGLPRMAVKEEDGHETL